MLTYLLRHLLHAVAIVAFAMVASFVMLQLAPGDPLQAVAGERALSATEREVLTRRFALDASLPEQLARHVARVARGDLGRSIAEQRPVATVLMDALPATLLLSGTALLLSTVLGVGIGSLQGWRPRDRVARLAGATLTSLYAIPEVVLGVALLATLAVRLRLFPVGGRAAPLIALTGDLPARLLDSLWHLALPAAALALGWGAAIARQQRVAMREAAASAFVRTARAKGVSSRAVWARHAMRPALPGTVALVGAMMPALVGGTVVVETLFSWPGMGSLVVRAVSLRDYPLVAGAVLLIAAVTALGTLLADLVVFKLDPRLRGEWSR